MTIPNHKLQLLVPALSELATLRTGAKLGYNVAYTLKKATEAQEIIEQVKKSMLARYETEKEAVDAEWQELMLQESSFEARPVDFSAVESCLDSDKITATLILQLGDFISEAV